MSRLEELIQELCPDGVEYKSLSCVASYSSERMDTSEITSDNYVGVDNLLPDKQGKTQSAYVPKDGRWIRYSSGDILIGNIRPYLKKIWLADREGGTNGDVLVIHRNCPEELIPKFLYYILSSDDFFLYDMQNAKGAKMPRGDKSAIMKYKIPVPPLEVQGEIVRILDSFTELTAELTAELTVRKQQYEYYANKLLRTQEGWEHIKIIDMLSQPITDGPHTTPSFVAEGVPFISVDAVWDGKIHFENMRGYITEEFDRECRKKYSPQKQDVFMVKSGSTTGKVAYVDTDIRFNIWSPLAAMRVNKNYSSRYLFYLLQTEKVQNMVKSKSSHGSQPNLSMRVLEQFEVDVPSLQIQEQIVSILDNFDSICCDLTSGLPAEIEARQKQYEYYRDKLLTFKEKEA